MNYREWLRTGVRSDQMLIVVTLARTLETPNHPEINRHSQNSLAAVVSINSEELSNAI